MPLPSSSSLFSLFLILSSSALLSSVVHGATVFTIDPWELPDGGTESSSFYSQFTAIVGDTVNFVYGDAGGVHDLFLHPDNKCAVDDNVVKIRGVNGPASYTFQFEDGSNFGKTAFFSCNTGQHCELGQHVRVVVFSTASAREKVQNGRNPVVDFPPPFETDDPSTGPNPPPTGSSGSNPSPSPGGQPTPSQGSGSNPDRENDANINNIQQDDDESHLSKYWVWYLVALIIILILVCCCIVAIFFLIIRPRQERESHVTTTTTTKTTKVVNNNTKNGNNNDDNNDDGEP